MAMSRDLQDWDPRYEDYLGWGGAGPGHLPPTQTPARSSGHSWTTGRRPRGLYVKNVPGTMSADSVRRLFSEYGRVESVVMGRTSPDACKPRWAIVNPHSTRDAVAMVSALHGRPPLCLSVTPAISPEEKRRQQRERERQQRFLEEVKREALAARRKDGAPAARTDRASSGVTTTTTTLSNTTTTRTTTTSTPISSTIVTTNTMITNTTTCIPSNTTINNTNSALVNSTTLTADTPIASTPNTNTLSDTTITSTSNTSTLSNTTSTRTTTTSTPSVSNTTLTTHTPIASTPNTNTLSDTTITSTSTSITTTRPPSVSTTTLTTTTTSSTTTTPHSQPPQTPFEVSHGVVLVAYRPVEPCVGCGAAGHMVCSVCEVWYCGRACQEAHWPLHQDSCIPPSAFTPTMKEGVPSSPSTKVAECFTMD